MWQQRAVFTFLETQLWIICILCEIALCIALIKRKLLRRYPCLFGLALVNALRDTSLLTLFGTSSPSYTRVWMATLPILMSLQAAAVIEAYTKLTSQYPGLGTFASKLVGWCLVPLLLATSISVICDTDHFTQSALQAVIFTYRYFAFILAGCLALPCLVLLCFPKPQRQPARNITVHLWMLVSYLCVYIGTFLSVNVVGIQEGRITVINVIMLLMLSGLYASWAYVLRPEGEASVQWPELPSDLVAMIDARGDSVLQRTKRSRRSGSASL
jgi:hypothetical protein